MNRVRCYSHTHTHTQLSLTVIRARTIAPAFSMRTRNALLLVRDALAGQAHAVGAMSEE